MILRFIFLIQILKKLIWGKLTIVIDIYSYKKIGILNALSLLVFHRILDLFRDWISIRSPFYLNDLTGFILL